MKQSSIEIVSSFAAAWDKLDIEAMMVLLAPEAVFHNGPMEILRGHEAIRANIELFIGICDRCEWKIVNIAGTPNGVVLTERVDSFALKSGVSAAVELMGRAEVNAAGLITLWRDYFDLSDWNRQLGLDPDFGRRALA